MKTLRLLFLLAVLSVSGIAKAQDSLFVLQNIDTLFNPPYSINDTTNILLPITNTSVSPFSGVINFSYTIYRIGVDTITYFGPHTLGISFDTTIATVIPAHSQVTKLLHFNFSSQEFIAGPSVVVIWPIAPGAVALDSATASFTILSGISPVGQDGLKAFMLGRQLIIESSDQLRDINIYDTRGALILRQEISTYATIPMQPFATGIYFAEVTLADNTHKVFKIYNPPQ